jgi:transcriptional regulator with PAS, ATPase and Fis domain
VTTLQAPAPTTPRRQAGFERILSQSEVMENTMRQAARAAQTEATMLITGESGTGKELIAEAIHRSSPRRENPFVRVNMAALPDTLIESELFGHASGAFTGATGARTGRFEAANKGSIFIDEIGDLKHASQAKLLRVLESHRITPVGSNESRPVDVRVIAATNRNLEAMVANGDFREDLYYRLNVISIALPPLRSRHGDVRLLIEHFLDVFSARNERPTPQIDGELMRYLERHEWPGNIRQLRNCMESMVVLADGGPLTMADLPDMARVQSNMRRPQVQVPRDYSLEDVERAVILQTLDRYDGNRTRAAHSLKISVRTLQRRLKQWASQGKLGQHENLHPVG